MSGEKRESEMLEHEGEDEISFTKAHEQRLDMLEKHCGVGKYAPKRKSEMERMKERKRHS